MSNVETAGVTSASANSDLLLYQDAADQLDFPCVPLSSIPNHDVDFDSFKADAQVIVDADVVPSSSAGDVSKESALDTPVATDSSHASSGVARPELVPGVVDPAWIDAIAPTATAVNGSQSRPRFVSPKDFELLKVIGMGAFGKVVQVRNKRSQHILAMKIISKRLLYKKGSSMIENVLIERNILQRIGSHPFIVTMHCSFQTREKLFIIMDFLAGGELFLRLGREGIFLEKTVRIRCFTFTIPLCSFSPSLY
jgi:Protein kinase domain